MFKYLIDLLQNNNNKKELKKRKELKYNFINLYRKKIKRESNYDKMIVFHDIK